MLRIIEDCKITIFSGLLLCVVCFFSSLLPYLQLGSGLFSFLTKFVAISGATVSVVSLTIRKPKFLKMVFRFLGMLVCFFAFWISGAYLGIWRTTYHSVAPQATSVSDNVSGMLWATPFFVAQIASLFTILIKGIRCGAEWIGSKI